EQCLHLAAVLSDDVEVIAPRLAVPVLLHIKSAELAKSIGAEQNLVTAVISDHDLGPMDHGRHIESQLVLAETEAVAFLDDQRAGKVEVKILLQHGKGFGVAHQLCAGIPVDKSLQTRRVVRLDM